jgi:hypothetical protein
VKTKHISFTRNTALRPVATSMFAARVMKRKLMTMVAATCLTFVSVQTVQAGDFPNTNPAFGCRSGYSQQGTRLCMSGYQGPDTFANAELRCTDMLGRLSDINDWRYRRFRGDGAPVFTPSPGTWLGPRTADDRALFANGQSADQVGNTDSQNFDGESNVFTPRYFTCSHDRL